MEHPKEKGTTDGTEYTEKQWEEEMRSPAIEIPLPAPYGSFAFGRNLPCPQCEVVGFYGPRMSVSQEGMITRKYRACKFCGFWQEVWGEHIERIGTDPYRCIALFCDQCRALNSYHWIVPWAEYEPGSCPNCHIERVKTFWASDDPSHPYQALKVQIARGLTQEDTTVSS